MDSTVRNFSSANEYYAAYVVERFEVCIITLNAVKLNLYNSTDVTLQSYRDQIDEILYFIYLLIIECYMGTEFG